MTYNPVDNFIAGRRVKPERFAFRERSELTAEPPPAAKSDGNWGPVTPIDGYGTISGGQLMGNNHGAALAARISEAGYACVRIRAQAVGSLKWRIRDRSTDKVLAESGDSHHSHPVAQSIDKETRRLGAPLFSVWEQAKSVTGESFIYLVSDQRERTGRLDNVPLYFRWLNPLAIEKMIYNGQIQEYYYTPQQGGMMETLSPAKTIFDKYFNLSDEFSGQSPMEAAINSINISRDSQRALVGYFRNGLQVSMILSPDVQFSPEGLTPEQSKRLTADLRANHKGVQNAFHGLILPFPFDVSWGQQPNLNTFSDLLDTIERRIYVAFGVSRVMVGDTDGASYKPNNDEIKWFYQNTVIPEARAIADVINMHIIPFFESHHSNSYFEFVTDKYDAAASTEITDANAMLEAGGITLNQWRERLGIDTTENGNIFYMPITAVVVPEEKLGAVQANPTYLPYQSPQTTIQQAGEMARGSGYDTPDTPDPETNLADEVPAEIVEGGVEPQLNLPLGRDADGNRLRPQLSLNLPRKAEANTGDAFAYVSLADHADIKAAQDAVREALRGVSGIQWQPPEQFHVTLVYAPDASDEQLSRVVSDARVTPVSITGTGLGLFENAIEHTLYVAVDPAPALRDLQRHLHSLFAVQNIDLSPFSEPDMYRPHITLAYLPQGVDVPDVQIGFTLEAGTVVIARDNYTPFARLERHNEQPAKAAQSDADSELAAWRKVAAKSINKATRFEVRHLPESLAREVKVALKGLGTDEIDIADSILLAADATHKMQGAGIDATLKTGLHLLYTGQVAMKTRAGYRRSLRSAVRGRWNGQLSQSSFEDAIASSIQRGLSQAVDEGLRTEGRRFNELDVDERAEVDREIAEELGFVSGFAEAVAAGSKDNGGALEPLYSRVELWVRTYDSMVELGVLIGAANKKKKWRRTPGKDSCVDCLLLDGKVFTAKQWREANVRPKMARLACTGNQCGCGFEDTDEPITPGGVPRLTGRKHDH